MTTIVTKYMVKFKASRQNEVIQLFMKAFPNHVKDVTRHTFTTQSWLYAFISIKDQTYAKLFITNLQLEPTNSIDVELSSYTDISMLPLMDVGIYASKSAND